jgi:hypothetical protein
MMYEYGEPQWIDTDRVKWKNLEKNLSQCHFTNATWSDLGLHDENPATN